MGTKLAQIYKYCKKLYGFSDGITKTPSRRELINIKKPVTDLSQSFHTLDALILHQIHKKKLEDFMFASKYLKTVLIIFFIFLFQNINFAHCDSMEGPVVKAAKQSLESGNINHVLIWVKPENEQEIKDLFQKALHVRGLDKDAKELADKYFFETIVRVHRMGEGVAYTGIKPAGYKPEKGIEEADIAVEKNNLDNLLKGLKEDDHAKVKELFQKLQAKKDFQVNNVQSGREYVESYVHFIHYVEGLYTGKEESHDAHKHH